MRRLLILAVALVILAAPRPDDAAAQPADLSRAIEAQERHTSDLLDHPGIVGTGVSTNAQGDPVIRVYVQSPGVGIPATLDNIPVERVVTGQIVARCYQAECPRPVPLGVSTGHPLITAGTLGARVTDGLGNVYALSNNHVYANSNGASIGDSALQPGPYDGGTNPGDKIGELAAFKALNFSGANNDIDAAIVSTTTAIVSNVTYSGYRPATTLTEGSIGLAVKKEGRTTGLTFGQISEINVTVNVCYEPRGPFSCAKLARFVDQMAVGSGTFSAGGDSGSLIVTQSGNNPVGLLFAGSSTRTFANRIQPVMSYFGVAIDDSTGSEPPPSNTPPTASFTFSCTGLTCGFDATGSSDAGGTIVGYTWDFGDSTSGSGPIVSHDYSSDGAFSVTLSVTDDDGAIDSETKLVSVSAPPGTGIQLSVSGYKVKGVQRADLQWSGAAGASVDVFRNNAKVATTANDGLHTDNIGKKGGGSYTYRVCEAGTITCSSSVTITF